MDKKLPGMDPKECTPREKTQMSLLENSTDLKSSAVLEEEMTSSNTTKDEMACAKTISLVFRDETFSKSNKVEHNLLQKKYLTLLKNPLKDKKIDESLYNVKYPENKSKLCNLKRKILDHKKNEGESKSDGQKNKILRTCLIGGDAASQKVEGISQVTSRSQQSIDKLRAIVSKDLWDQPNQESRLTWSPQGGNVPKFNVDQRIDENSVPQLFKRIDNLKQQLKEIIQLGSSTHNNYRKKDYINQSKETQKRIEECYVKLEARVLFERRKMWFNVLETVRKQHFRKQIGHPSQYQKPNEQQTQKQSISSTQQDYLQKLAQQGSSQQEFTPIQEGVSKQPMSLSQQRVSQSQVILTQRRASQQQDSLGHQETFQHQVSLAKLVTSQQQTSPAQLIASHHKVILEPEEASHQQVFLEYHGTSQKVVQAQLGKFEELVRLRPLEHLQKLIVMAEKGPSQQLLSLAHQVAFEQLVSLPQKEASQEQDSFRQGVIQQQGSSSVQGTSQKQYPLTLQKYLQNQVQLASKEYFHKLLRMPWQGVFQHQDPLEQQGTIEPQASLEKHGAFQQLVTLAQRVTSQPQISPAQQKYLKKLVCLATQEYLQKLVRLSQKEASLVQRKASRQIPLERQSVQDHQAPPKQQPPIPLCKKQRFQYHFSSKKPKQHLVSRRIQVFQPQLTLAGSKPIHPRQLNQLPKAFISQQMQQFSRGKQQTLPGQNVGLQLPSLPGHISVHQQMVQQKIINMYTLFHYLTAACDIFFTKSYHRDYLNFEYLNYIYICLIRSLQPNSRDLGLLKRDLRYNMKIVSSYLVRNQNKINCGVIATDINSINDMKNFNQLLKEKMFENKDLICNILQNVKEINKLFKKIATLTRRMRLKYVYFCSKNHERLFK